MGKLETVQESMGMDTEGSSSDYESDPETIKDPASHPSSTHGLNVNDESLKPAHSYIALIAMAILSSPSKKMVLSDIYKYVMDKYPFYKSQDKSWRNSVRHNLSLNECFIKVGRSENGKGNFWAVHPANVEDFIKGDYRRRRARRRNRKIGLSPGYAPIHPEDSYSRVKLLGEHLGGLYYHPYPVIPPTLRSLENKKLHSVQAPKPKKSFRIESILGIDKEENIERPEKRMKSEIPCPCCPPKLQGIPALLPTSPRYSQFRPASVLVAPKSLTTYKELSPELSPSVRHCFGCTYIPPRPVCSVSCLHEH